MARQDRVISLIPILPDLPPRRKRKMLIPSHGGALPVPLSPTAYLGTPQERCVYGRTDRRRH
jgi:hypothetical protein